MQGIAQDHQAVNIDGIQLVMVSIDSLRELYQRGLADTAETSDAADPAKHQAQKEKLHLLNSIQN